MLILGNYIQNLKCESFWDSTASKVRIRPLPDQGLPTDLVIECLREYRNTATYPLGTIFIAEDVKVCQKEVGRMYLRAKNQLLTRISQSE